MKENGQEIKGTARVRKGTFQATIIKEVFKRAKLMVTGYLHG